MKTAAKKQRFTKVIEAIKTAVLSLLVVSLVLLVTVYIGGTRAYENAIAKNSQADDFDKLWSVQNGAQPKGLDASRLMPEFIGYKQSASAVPTGSLANRDSLHELYELTKPCILELFGGDSTCRRLDAATGKALLEGAKSGDEFVYLRYHTPILYQLIYAYAADKLTLSETDVAAGIDGNVGAYVSELIIVPDKDFAAHRFVAYATDSDGNYYEFRPSEHIVASDFYISKLAGSAEQIEVHEFEFSRDSVLTDMPPIVFDEIKTDNIVESIPMIQDEYIRTELLRLFGYNTDKLDGYADNDTYIYVDSHSQLRIKNEGVSFITYDAADSDVLRGIKIDSLLGYTSSDSLGLFDKLTAVDNLIGRIAEISPELVGGEASLCLGDVYSDGSLLVIEYFLTYNGVRIKGGPCLRAVLTEKTICELELTVRSVSTVGDYTLALRPMFVLDILKSKQALTQNTRGGAVSLIYSEGTADWTVTLAE